MKKEQAKRKAFLPLIGMIIMYCLLVYYGVFSKGPHSYADNFIMLIAIALAVIVPIYTFVITVQFIIFVTKLPDISEAKKIFWGIMMYFFNVFVFPIFWNIHMKNREFNYDEWEMARSKQNENRIKTNSQTPYYTRNTVYSREESNNNKEERRRAGKNDNKVVTAIVAFLPLSLLATLILLIEFENNFGMELSHSYYEMVDTLGDKVTLCMVASGLVAYITYICVAVRNVGFSIGKKIIWIIAFTTCSFFIFPIYWKMHICNKRNESAFGTVLSLLMFLIWIIWSTPVLNSPLVNMLNNIFLFFTIVIYIVSVLKYTALTWENKQLHIIKKILWSGCFILLGIITCPIYWKRYIRISEGQKMKEKSKIFWAYAPIVFLVLGILLLVISSTQTVGGVLTSTGQVIAAIATICTLVAVVITYVSMVIFIVAACKNPAFSTGKKVFWGIMLYLFNMFAYLVYLHKYILKEQEM